MITQEYTTTLDAIRSRFRAGKINRVEISLRGFRVRTSDVADLDVYDGTQTVHVREYRHDTNSELFEERRNVVLHENVLDAPDGRL